MNCPRCGQANDENNAFCVGCGEVFKSGANLPPTIVPDFSNVNAPTQVYPIAPNPNEYQSEATVFGGGHQNFQPPQNQAGFQPLPPNFDPSTAYSAAVAPSSAAPKSRLALWFGLSLAVILFLALGGLGAWYFATRTTTPAEVLPGHLGLFIQNNEKTKLDELRKFDFKDGFDARDKLQKDSSVQTVSSRPNVVLYSDGKDIPLTDLKLIQLDSIKGDGSMKQIDFKSNLVDGKPAMKRIFFAENLAKGKYAFALLDGNFDDGKHKFWPFQITESDRNDNGSISRDATVAVKNKPNANTETAKDTPTPTPKPTVAPPKNAEIAYVSGNSVVLRGSPSLDGQKLSALKRGQKLYVIAYSENSDYWNGLEGNWANVQTEGGQRGWVFSPLINY